MNSRSNGRFISYLLNNHNFIFNANLIPISNQRSKLNLNNLKKAYDDKRASPVTLQYILNALLYIDLNRRRLLFDTDNVEEYFTDLTEYMVKPDYSLLSVRFKGVKDLVTLKSIKRSYLSYLEVSKRSNEIIEVDPETNPEPVKDEITTSTYVKEHKDDVVSILHEIIIGLYGTNPIRNICPNFMYLLGGFRLGTYVTDDKGKVVYMNENLPLNYVVYENMDQDVILSDILPSLTYQEFISITLQVFESLYVANRMSGFTHNSLTPSSIAIRRMNRPCSIKYDSYIETDSLAMMFNFTKSFCNILGRPFGNGGYPDFFHDVNSYISSCTKMSYDRNLDIYNICLRLQSISSVSRTMDQFILNLRKDFNTLYVNVPRYPVIRHADNTKEVLTEYCNIDPMSNKLYVTSVEDYYLMSIGLNVKDELKKSFDYVNPCRRQLQDIDNISSLLINDINTLTNNNMVTSMSNLNLDQLYTIEALSKTKSMYFNVAKIKYSLDTCERKLRDVKVVLGDYESGYDNNTLELSMYVNILEDRLRTIHEVMDTYISVIVENNIFLDSIQEEYRNNAYPYYWYWDERRKYFHD